MKFKVPNATLPRTWYAPVIAAASIARGHALMQGLVSLTLQWTSSTQLSLDSGER
jgi:hypothetical protein